MKNYFYSIFFILLFASFQMDASAQCANSSNIYTFNFNGHSYQIVKEMKSWANAAACAVEKGGYLVQIGSQAEQDTIYSRISKAGISTTYTAVGDGGGTAYIWIGATDKTTEGAWKWDGTNSGVGTAFWNGQGAAGLGGGSSVGSAFINWGGKSAGTIQEPDDYGSIQDAAAIALAGWPAGTTMLGIGGEWNDIAPTNTLYYIIEYDFNVGLNEQILDKIILKPNPISSNNILYIQHADNGIEQIIMYDNVGKMVLNSTFQMQSEVEVPLNNLSDGLYFILIKTSNNQFISKKLVIE